MRRNLVRFVLMCGVGGWFGGISTVDGATFALRAVEINGNPVAVSPQDPNPQVINVSPGNTIKAEIRIFDFPELNPVGAKVYSAQLDNLAGTLRSEKPVGFMMPGGNLSGRRPQPKQRHFDRRAAT